MAVDRLDISIFEEDSAVIVAIAGRLDAAVAPGLREKLDSFSEGGQRIVLDLLRVHSVAEETVRMLLQFLSDLRGQGGTLSLLCVQPDILEKFAPYRNLIEIHPSLASLFRSGFHSGKQRTLKWSRRTGIRITAPLALFLALLLSGWIATLLSLVVWQFRELEVDREELVRLRHERETAQKTVDELETRLKPLADLGLLDMPKAGRRVRAARTGAGAVVATSVSADSSRFMKALRDSIAVERGALRATDTAKGARP